MTTPFNVDEILRMAVQIEAQGARFYREAARRFLNVSEFFKELAQQEDAHLQTFEDMRRSLRTGSSHEFMDVSGELDLYLKALVESQDLDIQRNPMEVLGPHPNLADVVRFGLKLEEDSIAFYAGLRDAVCADHDRQKLDAILNEERRHVLWLNEKHKEWSQTR